MGVRGQASVIMKLTSGEPPFSSMEQGPYRIVPKLSAPLGAALVLEDVTFVAEGKPSERSDDVLTGTTRYSRKNLRQPMTHARLRLATHIKGLIIEVVPGCPLEPECAERFQELWVASLETARDSHVRR